mgnify:CR=1 FL=1
MKRRKNMALTKFEQFIIRSAYWDRKRAKEIKILTNNVSCHERKILNIGSGGGVLTDKLLKAEMIINIDLENAQHVDSVACATELPFAENRFDVIIFLRVLHHIDDFTKAMEEALRCLKPKGSILISEPYYYAVKLLDMSRLTSHPKNIIRKGDIEKFVKEHGLTITKKFNRIFWFYYGYQIQLKA